MAFDVYHRSYIDQLLRPLGKFLDEDRDRMRDLFMRQVEGFLADYLADHKPLVLICKLLIRKIFRAYGKILYDFPEQDVHVISICRRCRDYLPEII